LWFEVFQVSNRFLIKIYEEANNAGSPSQNEAEDSPSEDIIPPSLLSVYLVEPRQASSAILMFSGTLGMHNQFDRQSASIMAFSHFIISVPRFSQVQFLPQIATDLTEPGYQYFTF